MNVFNDRQAGSFETWADDKGILRHVALVQDPGKPLNIYLDGSALKLPPYTAPSKFGSSLLNTSFSMKDGSYKAASGFRKLLADRKPGWYRGSVDYYLDEDGKIKYVDEVKVMFSGDETPTEMFKPRGDVSNNKPVVPHPEDPILKCAKPVAHFDDTGDYLKAGTPEDYEIGTKDFILEGWVDNFRITAEGADMAPFAPVDGKWHTITLTRKSDGTFVHTQEKVNGVDYLVVAQFNKNGDLVEKKYTRADAVNGNAP